MNLSGTPEGLHGAVTRYRVMAFIVGTALLCLTAVVIFQATGHLSAYHGGSVSRRMAHPATLGKVVAIGHGYLYLIYLVAAADLARRARWRLGRIVAVVCAGFVPFLAFIVEHRVYQQMQAEWAAEAAAGADQATVSRGTTV